MNLEEIEFIIKLKEEIDTFCQERDVNDETCKVLYEKLFKISNKAMKTSGMLAKPPDDSPKLNEIKTDTTHLRLAIESKGNISVDYSFVKNEEVFRRLTKDNLRMEDTYLSNEIKNPIDRFYLFCVLAFYQIEELINYYYFEKFPIFENLVTHLSNYSNFKLDREKGIKEVRISVKIFAFEKIYFYNRRDERGKKIFYDSIIDKIKKVRDEESHRCSVIAEDKEGVTDRYFELLKKIKEFNRANLDPSLHYLKSKEDSEIEKRAKFIKFMKKMDFNVVRNCLHELSRVVKENSVDVPKTSIENVAPKINSFGLMSIEDVDDDLLNELNSL